LANNVGYGEVYVKSDWGTSPKYHLKTIIEYATAGLKELVKLTIDNTIIRISSLFYRIDQTQDV